MTVALFFYFFTCFECICLHNFLIVLNSFFIIIFFLVVDDDDVDSIIGRFHNNFVRQVDWTRPDGTGSHHCTEEDLAKFGYRSEKKVNKIWKQPYILPTCQNLLFKYGKFGKNSLKYGDSKNILCTSRSSPFFWGQNVVKICHKKKGWDSVEEFID